MNEKTKKKLKIVGFVLCAPLAICVSACEDSKKSYAKKKEKKARKEAEFRKKYPEFDYWQDNQGL